MLNYIHEIFQKYWGDISSSVPPPQVLGGPSPAVPPLSLRPWLDYCNSLFLNLESTQLKRLQLIQNSLARAVTRTPKHHHITPILKSLHWFKIPERIHFKVLSLTYNSVQYSKPSYLRDLFTIQPTRSTRSSSILTLSRVSTSGHYSSQVFQLSNIQHCTTPVERSAS